MAEDTVYLGLWTNYSKGRILGATLTTTQQNGALLIAFTGFLIPFVASRFWKLLCIALHSSYSTLDPQNAVHHQRQVILRNSSSPDSALVSCIQMIMAWHRLKWVQGIQGVRMIIIYAAVTITVFSVAGGLSAQISVSAGHEVLLLSTNCGVPDSSTAVAGSYYAWATQGLSDVANYVQQCYSGNSSKTLTCDRFISKTLPTTIAEYNASCPFQQGYIDSNLHLGLNLPLHQGFAYRRTLSCSPLITDGFSERSVVGNTSYVQYNYGGFSLTSENLTYTYEYEDLDTQYRYQKHVSGSIPSINYVLASTESITVQGSPATDPGYFIPISNISRHDGDVLIIFLSGNGVQFLNHPMNDEWYRASIPLQSLTLRGYLNQSEVTYALSEAASPLGCVEQFQWCNTAYPKDAGCGPLASFNDAALGAAQFFDLNQEDLGLSRPSSNLTAGTNLIWPLLITLSFAGNDLDSIIRSLGSQTLASQSLLEESVQLPLPANQWQIDVTKWWNLSLASLQSSYLETALGTAPSKLLPLNDPERRLCSSQKISNHEFSNFNLFALLLTYITSAVIILASFIAEPLLAWLSRNYGYKQLQQLEWVTNESLQLHRLAQEELGLDHWSNGAKKVPTTSNQWILLRSLDISNPKHPVLSRTQGSPQCAEEPGLDQYPSESGSHCSTAVQAVGSTDPANFVWTGQTEQNVTTSSSPKIRP
ncbi:hypothetical protein GGR57DRAFT_513817 [Xylariaceae sp. FL1272]|nr:hypothetical protein GGR57DRAFT_513817 [Xylariaceae sp. FL1272]